MCCIKGYASLFLIFNSLIVCLETATPSPSLKLTILPSKHPTSRPSGYLLKHFIFEIKIVINYFQWMLDHRICAPDNWNTHTAFFGHLFVIVGFTHKTILVWMNGQSQRINCFCGNKFSPQIYILCILFLLKATFQVLYATNVLLAGTRLTERVESSFWFSLAFCQEVKTSFSFIIS